MKSDDEKAQAILKAFEPLSKVIPSPADSRDAKAREYLESQGYNKGVVDDEWYEDAVKAHVAGYTLAANERDAVDREKILEVCREWKGFWMNQTQNSEADRKNYFNRACGIDANMIHHLADKITASINKGTSNER